MTFSTSFRTVVGFTQQLKSINLSGEFTVVKISLGTTTCIFLIRETQAGQNLPMQYHSVYMKPFCLCLLYKLLHHVIKLTILNVCTALHTLQSPKSDG